MEKRKIGRNLYKYRARIGMSQFEIEQSGVLSSGAMSRVESGKVNPTKETMLEIAKRINLSPVEQAALFGIEIEKFGGTRASEFVKEIELDDYLIDQISSFDYARYTSLDKTLLIVLNEMINKLSVISPSIYFLNADNEKYRIVKSQASEQSRLIAKELSKNESDAEIEFPCLVPTLISECLRTGETQISTNLFEMIAMKYGQIYSIQKLKSTNLVGAMPLQVDKKIFGVITFQLKDEQIDDKKLEKIRLFVESTSLAIFNSIRVEKFDHKSANLGMISNEGFGKNLINRSMLSDVFRTSVEFGVNLVKVFYEIAADSWAGSIGFIMFFLMSIYWLFVQIFYSTDSWQYRLFGDTYGIFAVIAAIMAVRVAKIFTFNSRFGKVAYLFCIALIFQEIGQLAYVTLTHRGVLIPYPFWGDIFFIISNPIFALSMIYIYRIKMNFNYAFFSLIYCIFLYQFSIYNYINEGITFIKVIYDITFILTQSLNIYTILSVFKNIYIDYKRSKRIKATDVYPIALLFLLFADFLFTIQVSLEEWTQSNFSDYLYFIGYFLFYFSLLLSYSQEKVLFIKHINLNDIELLLRSKQSQFLKRIKSTLKLIFK